MGKFLSGATAWPFGGPEIVESQLADAKAAGCSTWQEAMCWADEQTTKKMQEFQDARDCEEMMRL